jgi:hypothetical protein
LHSSDFARAPLKVRSYSFAIDDVLLSKLQLDCWMVANYTAVEDTSGRSYTDWSSEVVELQKCLFKVH